MSKGPTTLGNLTDKRAGEDRREDSDPAWNLRAPGIQAKVSPRRAVAAIAGVLTMVGGITWWQAKPAESRPSASPSLELRVDRLERKVLPYLDWLVQQEIRRQEREGRTVEPPRVE